MNDQSYWQQPPQPSNIYTQYPSPMPPPPPYDPYRMGQPYQQQYIQPTFYPPQQYNMPEPGKRAASIGLTLSLLSICLLTPLAIPGLIFSLIGLQSKTSRKSAIWGVVISILVIVGASIYILSRISS